MQNKICLTLLLLASIAVMKPVCAQDVAPAPVAEDVLAVGDVTQEQGKVADGLSERVKRAEQARQRREDLERAREERRAARQQKSEMVVPEPVEEPEEEDEEEETSVAPAVVPPKAPAVSETMTDDMTREAIREENRRRLEEELQNMAVSGKGVVDFPNRLSLGALELTPLPGINESAVGSPLPMGKSVSGKDLPSEQLLGRITPEVFQEMADLERGNTFLKLQLEKEKLKNDLEQLKATYRQKRLDEIAKREDVVRTRIQWWQEQEKLRLAIEQKQQEEEDLARKIAMKEAERDQVQAEAKRRLGGTETDDQVEDTGFLPQAMENLYVIESIRGIGTDLTAKIRSKSDGMVMVVKQDDILPSGHVVQEVKKDTLVVAYGNRVDQLVFRPNQQ